jgi:mannose-6-phosphate isomerase-like protein (cupin superfamily)
MINLDSNEWHYDEQNAKVVVKPWGREVWINYRKGEEVGDKVKRYVMKKLYIKKGTKTSFQYHKHKVETNFLIEGSVEAWFEDKKGHIDIKVLESGSIWTIPAGIKHRIVTLEDIILMESSSPEVDDVIRIEDDTLRGDGRIQDEHNLGNK